MQETYRQRIDKEPQSSPKARLRNTYCENSSDDGSPGKADLLLRCTGSDAGLTTDFGLSSGARKTKKSSSVIYTSIKILVSPVFHAVVTVSIGLKN